MNYGLISASYGTKTKSLRPEPDEILVIIGPATYTRVRYLEELAGPGEVPTMVEHRFTTLESLMTFLVGANMPVRVQFTTEEGV